MRTFFRKAVMATALSASAVTGVMATATPAMADPWRGGYGGYHHGGDTAGAAIAGGIIGLAVGAAIASDHPRYERVERVYYDAPPPPPPPVYYREGWAWHDGYYWDGDGRRFDRWGHPCGDYYERRGWHGDWGYHHGWGR